MSKILKNVPISTEVIRINNPLPFEHPCSFVADIRMDSPKPEALPDSKPRQDELNTILHLAQEEIQHEKEELRGLKQQLETLLNAIPKAIEHHRLNLSDEIADISLLITQQYFVERQANPEALRMQINHVLSQLNQQQEIELYLHPKDIALLQEEKRPLETAHIRGLHIKSDDSLTLGGCVIKTNHGVFDASIEQQIERLKDFLLEQKQRSYHAFLD